MMNPVPLQQHILDAIDMLRHRKARPDAERIYNSLFRRHSISCSDAKIALERCIENGTVLRVAYKGNISYRNATKKYSHLKRDSRGEIIRVPGKPRRKFTALLANAFTELVIREPDYLAIGIPSNELARAILSKDSVRYTKRYVNILLEKEVEAGSLVRIDNGNFLFGPNTPAKTSCVSAPAQQQAKCIPPPPQLHRKPYSPPSSADSENEAEVRSVDETSPPSPQQQREQSSEKQRYGKIQHRKDESMDELQNEQDLRNDDSLRVGGRRKRAKKVFDPSEHNMPKKRGRPGNMKTNGNGGEKQLCVRPESELRPDSRNSLIGREQGGVCSVCHVQSKKGPNDKMVSCRECSNKAHSSCLNGDDMMLKMYPDNTWQCPHCKTCVVCFETSDAGYLAVCSICADGYHLSCHQPKITEKIKSGTKWLCINCQMPEQLAVDRIQIGYDIENAKLSINNNDANSGSPDESRASSPFNSPSLSPTPPTLSPQTTPRLMEQHHEDELQAESPMSDSKSDILSIKEEDIDENVDPSIPDASNWSSEQVYQYFAQYFPEEATVFKEQEIDGHSLLLMKRMDVLKGLALKLGPALKIYRHVLKLQYRRDDPNLYWA